MTSDSSSPPKIRPEGVTFDIWSAAMTDWPDGAETSFGRYVDDVSEPEIEWNMTAVSPSPKTLQYPAFGSLQGSADCWPTGFLTYPSPDPLPGTDCSPGYRKPFCIHSGWASDGAVKASPHDQWLEASRSTTDDDRWPQTIYNNAGESDFSFFRQQHIGGWLPDQSLGGAVHESLSGSGGVYWQLFDNDYIDDVLSVMAKAAYNTPPTHEFA